MEIHKRGITAEEIKGLVGESPLMLEIGCHEGSDTAKFLEAMPEARIYCFDPEKRATARFKELLGKDPRVSLQEVAVADVNGLRDFHASTGKAGRREDWDFSGSLCEPTGHYTRSPEIKFKEPAPVPCICLDTWYYEAPGVFVIDFIWADIQGSQRLFLAGAGASLSRTKYLYIESHNPPAYANEPTQTQLMVLLAEGFNPVGFYGENILFQNRSFV